MTVSLAEIRGVLARYLDAHPDRAPGVARLTHALVPGRDLASRSTFPLHVTASAAAIDGTGRVLMIHHRALNRWLLPGGHVEPGDHSLYGAALRELEEETGIPWQHAVSPPAHDVIPVDVDVHEIPANPAKPEPAHWHADFRFAFWVKDTPITLQTEEVTAFGWRSPADLPTVRLADSVGAI
ncbi:NUDIX domain-containing protein [Nonomuraea fuscirosea]|jgi:8-oxo-dGTP pyrophosphatase MutT (NUDIX family)|uniref:NUDIX hydrolase n=1 Tax=Nonomuraea fuscirosea TaxID=1291556 RepID=UPI002DDB6B18|nr:NUDIX domain-containing protein [Nonomuraea fuscirosea]WSA58088.1 NUDIX domain-containing protein [Nonomuraea fuscirosea]